MVPFQSFLDVLWRLSYMKRSFASSGALPNHLVKDSRSKVPCIYGFRVWGLGQARAESRAGARFHSFDVY